MSFSAEELKSLACCRLCPRNCGADRLRGPAGFCKSDAGFHISSICIHQGEEPVISGKKGIVNIFFSRCNLQCLYCQNHEISRNQGVVKETVLNLEEVIATLKKLLPHSENIIGFVSPSHFVPHVRAIIRRLREEGLHPVFVYNSNGYDKVETLQSLEGYIDIYLPDFKYLDPELSFNYSQARNYPEVAGKAIREMYRQKGATLKLSDSGIAESGLIIRHLVLPHAAENSIKVLNYIAEELSERIHISLMSQYFPTEAAKQIPQLNRLISAEEYQQVTDAFYTAGFFRGWLQEPESHANYRPSFDKEHPFE